MNRFWNELEEIFDRLDDITIEHKVDSIEEAENILNETLECDKEVESAFSQPQDNLLSCWCEKDDHSDGDVSGYSSNFEDDEAEADSSFDSSYDEDDSLLASPSSYVSFDYLPLPPSFDKTLSQLKITHL